MLSSGNDVEFNSNDSTKGIKINKELLDILIITIIWGVAELKIFRLFRVSKKAKNK